MEKHIIDRVAQSYMNKLNLEGRMRIPVHVLPDGNCLYNSIIVFFNESTVGVHELRGIVLIVQCSLTMKSDLL